MWTVWKVLAASFFVFIFGFVSSAAAGVYTYYDVMIGGRSAQMGGAYTAVAEDGAAVYFNPAGLGQITTPSLSISANGLDIQTYTLQKRLFGQDLTFRSNAFFPSAWSVVRSLGEYRLAFSAIVPSNLDVVSTTNFREVILAGQSFSVGLIDSRIKDRVYLIGPSLAYRITPTLMVGATLYYWYGEALRETTLFFGGTSGQSQVGQFNRISTTTHGLLGQIGLLVKPSEAYSVGLLLRAPVPLDQTIQSDNQEYTFDATSGVFTNSFSQTETSRSARRPPGATVGLAFHPAAGRTLSVDLSYYGSASYSFSSREVEIRPVWNAAIGFEEVILPKFPVRFGLYTNRSAAPRLNDNPTVQDDRVDSYGATFGVGYLDELSTFDVGMRYALGKGKTKDATTGERFNVESQVLTLFVSGSILF
jgi:long-chain fatty acid transport protein